LICDYTTSARWQFDVSYTKAALAALDPQVKLVVTDAHNGQTKQQNQAQSDLTQGVKALIDVPCDSGQAAAIVKLAHAQTPRVPVLGYDRLITGAFEDAYASFNGFSVGVAQGTFLKAHVAKGGTIMEIAGADTDNNAHLFHLGAMSILQPLFNSGYYKLGYSKFTPNWDGATAQQECASALNSLKNKVNGVLVANDNMAGYCITALKAQGLAGKIPVTGQDGQASGLQQILLGYQSMTVYKFPKILGQAAAKIVDLWLHHKTYHGNSAKTMIPGVGATPTFLSPVVTVTKANMKATELKDGYVTRAELCKGFESACKANGI
jgi:D-xylose transport system substrate-binding protein